MHAPRTNKVAPKPGDLEAAGLSMQTDEDASCVDMASISSRAAHASRKSSTTFQRSGTVARMSIGPSAAEDKLLRASSASLLGYLSSLRTTVILPTDERYISFWYVTVFTSVLMAFMEPYKLAFTSAEAFAPENALATAAEVVCTMVFLLDIISKFFLAYKHLDTGSIVTDLRRIRIRYVRKMFWFDVVVTFPFAAVILTARPDLMESTTGLYISLLGFLKLGRLYDVSTLFQRWDNKMVLGQAQLMFLRNLTYIFLACHCFACIFYFVARVEGFSPASWVGAAYERFDEQPAFILYVNSIYLAVVTFSGLGDSAMYAQSPVEEAVMTVFCVLNVFLAAYILGTVTMLMVKADEKSSVYRGHMSVLKQYSRMHGLPEDLENGMEQHLEVAFLGEHFSDEKLLSTYPSAIKRRVLRHMYEAPLRECFLFGGLKPKFLDALMASCRTDVFMPHVQLLSYGDVVSDLYMVIEGEVEVLAGHDDPSGSQHKSMASMGAGAGLMSLSGEAPDRSQARGGGGGGGRRASRGASAGDSFLSKRLVPGHMGAASSRSQSIAQRQQGIRLSTSQPFGEAAFFTETPSTETVWTLTVVKVLMISRLVYDALQGSHPRQIQKILANLKSHYEQELHQILQQEVDAMDPHSPLYERLHPHMVDHFLIVADMPSDILLELQDLVSGHQTQMVEDLRRVKEIIDAYLLRQEQQRTIELLDAASKGSEETIRKLLAAGVSPNKGDYDKRTALMVASQEGKENVVRMLVKEGADVNALDIFGTNALVGAVKAGHGKCIDALLEGGASLANCTSVLLIEVIRSITSGDMALLSRYLDAGTNPNLEDHAHSTLLHVAAAEGSMSAVKMLLDAGADVLLTDRWGNRAVDDARRAEAGHVVRLLEPLIEEAEGVASPVGGGAVGNRSLAHQASKAQFKYGSRAAARGAPSLSLSPRPGAQLDDTLADLTVGLKSRGSGTRAKAGDSSLVLDYAHADALLAGLEPLLASACGAAGSDGDEVTCSVGPGSGGASKRFFKRGGATAVAGLDVDAEEPDSNAEHPGPGANLPKLRPAPASKDGREQGSSGDGAAP